MISSHCICPSFLSKNIADADIFLNIFIGKFIFSGDQIVLDKEERLTTSYITSLEKDIDGFNNYKAWAKMLEQRQAGKTLLSTSGNSNSFDEIVYKTISSAITTFSKNIITENNNHYVNFINEINRQRINLLNLQSLTHHSAMLQIGKNPTYLELELDVEWVLQRLGRLTGKDKSEDDYNDYVRDMLLSKKYEVKDQTREGSSSSGQGAGELDIIIEDQQNLFSIIEAMKLNCVDSGYIERHYLKLLSNYNPLAIKRTFLITYYTGSNFSDWWSRYKNHISNLDMRVFVAGSVFDSHHIDEQTTSFGCIKKMHHHLISRDEHSICTHIAIKTQNK
ncbi:hypothetical protein PFLuk1_04796 [Pseudomonas fluorescens]|uniref:hypothetical protein n=1 Tax=Pseudomonas paracarnis TaxID=2750625 RepID=UPI000762D3E6|nr:hypothetical protein [Pseudomonas paracarnis]KWV66835.1 hypothetical protein PFLuk1_04796 [Pseudomonas fluorescens]